MRLCRFCKIEGEYVMQFIIARIMGFFFTYYGFYLFCTGNLTNGLLAMILGELIDVPKIKLPKKEK